MWNVNHETPVKRNVALWEIKPSTLKQERVRIMSSGAKFQVGEKLTVRSPSHSTLYCYFITLNYYYYCYFISLYCYFIFIIFIICLYYDYSHLFIGFKSV